MALQILKHNVALTFSKNADEYLEILMAVMYIQ